MDIIKAVIILTAISFTGCQEDQSRRNVDQEEYLHIKINNGEEHQFKSNDGEDNQSSISDGQNGQSSSDIGVQADFAEIPMAVIKAITSAVFTACDQVKLLQGVTYEQLAGKNEPDVNALTLKYVSRDNESRTYNINSAAQAIVEEARTFSPDEKLFIYIHGFTSSPRESDFGNVSQALFVKGIHHVMALDAGFLIDWWYLRSTSYVRFIGQKLGDVLAALVNNGISASSIHIIGHSLGSHMASFTGKKFRQLTGRLVGRITGLDPAGPCFTQGDKELRLQASDAEFVDAIHTNAGVLGIEEPVGHVDYYPNGGSAQPGCNLSPGCCHGMSWLFFCESVLNEQAFPAVECNSWDDFKFGKCLKNISYMGFASKPTVRGKYYLQTNGVSPFSLGDRGLKYEEKTFTHTITEALF
ncbi:phospholipase A1-like [Plodia interpunctella]|uniref:phospholipase A1-like n=1 Tax=Plodia interpunctella TaxID=58824 RepID=UPI002367981D|nr:phospholipase A1-like [Plodia interpunctella]